MSTTRRSVVSVAVSSSEPEPVTYAASPVRSAASFAVSAEALEDTVDIDVFSPPRADWLAQQDTYLR